MEGTLFGSAESPNNVVDVSTAVVGLGGSEAILRSEGDGTPSRGSAAPGGREAATAQRRDR